MGLDVSFNALTTKGANGKYEKVQDIEQWINEGEIGGERQYCFRKPYLYDWYEKIFETDYYVGDFDPFRGYHCETFVKNCKSLFPSLDEDSYDYRILKSLVEYIEKMSKQTSIPLDKLYIEFDFCW